MTKLESILEAARDLSAEELAKLRAFLDELEADLWDAQIERDAAEGKLDKLIAEAVAEDEADKTINRDGPRQHYFSSAFLKSYKALPEDVQRKPDACFELFRQDPQNPGVKIKKISSR
jgi:hypothetical protein